MLLSFPTLGKVQTSLSSALAAPELDIALGLASVWLLRSLSETFDDLQAHPAVVVRAFPESGMVLAAVDASFCITAPEPFTEFAVNEVSLDVFPAA